MKKETNDFSHAIYSQCEDVADWLKSLSHPIRLKILCALIEGEKKVGDLQLHCKTSQSAMSQYLARMKNEDLIDSRREGHCVYYFVQSKKTIKLLKAIKEIVC